VPENPGRRSNAAGQAFGNRYDFGASLSAAIQAASTAMGDRSGFKDDTRSAPPKQMNFSNDTFVESPPTAEHHAPHPRRAGGGHPDRSSNDPPKPAALTSTKPSLQSSSYHELLDKYCFFGSAKGSPTLSRPSHDQLDGVVDTASTSKSGSRGSTSPSPPQEGSPPPPYTQSPPSPKTSPPVEENHKPKANGTSRFPRSTSPATGHDIRRNESPTSFGYPFGQPTQPGFFSEAHTPTAIRG